MPKPETLYYRNRVKPMLIPMHCRYNRIETGATTRGFPDCDVTYKGHNVKIELKVVDKGVIHISPYQFNWHNKEAKAGGKSFFLVWEPTARESWAFTCKDVQPDRKKGLRLINIPEKKLISDDEDLVSYILSLFH